MNRFSVTRVFKDFQHVNQRETNQKSFSLTYRNVLSLMQDVFIIYFTGYTKMVLNSALGLIIVRPCYYLVIMFNKRIVQHNVSDS